MNHITYQVITTIKKTEKSIVMLAAMEGMEIPVIIKRLKNANLEVYSVLSKINNVHIPRIYAMECQGEELIIAEEYVDGETLEYSLRQGIFSKEKKLELALQICEAVEVLHNCSPQIIHRDIKPSNIIITEDGILKLIDFDASRQHKEKSECSDTRILGTADYAAPEQFGYKQTDVRSDIYSMGIVFEMLDISAKGLAAFLWKRVLNICTSFDPNRRYKNVDTLAKSIRSIALLQKYQWYVMVCLFCLIFLTSIGLFWNYKPLEPEVEEPTEEIEEVDQDKLASIEQMLDEKGAYVSEYYQGEQTLDYFFYSDFFENDIEIINATLIDIVNAEHFGVEDSIRVENSIIMLDGVYMQTLKPSYYRLEVELINKSTDIPRMAEIHIRVYSEREPFVENEFALETNWLDYNYEQYDTLHIILCENTKAKITGLHMVNYGLVDSSQYNILYDGRAAELSANLLEACKNTKEILFEVELDDGSRERLTIVNPYLQ